MSPTMPDPQVPPSEQLRHRAHLRTRWSDEDNVGVVNNAVYLTLLEEARYSYFSSLGLLQDGTFTFLLAQTNVRFLQPGSGATAITVEMGTLHLGNSSFQQAYRIRGEGGEVWCEALARLVCVGEDGRPRPMAPVFRARVAEYEGLGTEDDA